MSKALYSHLRLAPQVELDRCSMLPTRIALVFALLCVVLSMISGSAALGDTPVITPAPGEIMAPGHSAYLEPNNHPDGMDVSLQDGITGWASNADHVVWYGDFPNAGLIQLRLALRLPQGDRSTFRLTATPWPLARHSVKSQTLVADTVGDVNELMVSLGSIQILHPGPYQFVLEGVSRTGASFGSPDALLAGGPGSAGAHFSLSNFRGAPSVHLHYTPPAGASVTWFYNEVTPTKTPVWSYFEACGFSRGYFGIQVNSETERRVIFSVWDSGDEPKDRSKVPLDDQVQLLAKGPGVYAGSFGNEGTGGHSHLVYSWKTGQTYRFLVSAQPDGTGTIYSGYFYFPEKKSWGLIASFRAPKDGGTLHGLYSFIEDFGDANGYMPRYGLFGPAWVRTDEGKWTELSTAEFTHTDDVKERPDRAGGVVGKRFFLSTGGFIPSPEIRYGDTFTRQASGSPPVISLPPLPQPTAVTQ